MADTTIEITIDCNSDEVRISGPEHTMILPQPKTMRELEHIIHEVVESIAYGADYISLIRIDENTRTLLGEW